MAGAKIWQSNVKLELSVTLSEAEARALNALTEYSTDNFIKFFYEHMGTSCLKPHEAGLRSLFLTVRAEFGAILRRADQAREAFTLKAQ